MREIAVYVLSAMASGSTRMAGDPEVDSRTSGNPNKSPEIAGALSETDATVTFASSDFR